MDLDTQRKVAAILRVLDESGGALGSSRLARELRLRGIDLKARMIRYYLDQMDNLGFTENLGRRGRRLTARGRRELESAVAVDRVGFVSARVDELAYRLTFDPETLSGSVIMNVSLLPAKELGRALKIARRATGAGLGMGRHLVTARAGETVAGITVPRGRAAIGTICSVTLNGIMYARGIPMASVFGGLLEMENGRPTRFTQIIRYDGTTIDPIEIFIKGGMTRVGDVSRTGTGTVGAGFREIPAGALSAAQELVDRLERVGVGSVLAVGLPGKPLLDVPVSQGRVGIVVPAGLNPVAAAEEAGVPTENRALAALADFAELTSSEAQPWTR
ncbi:MAG: DUF128 domain-containing protein [Planctomycetota bacterium]|jgi:repressor of nif and glnA expression